MYKATLLDLPYEIFLDIFEQFDQVSLSRIAHTCQTLHKIALSIIVKRQLKRLQNLADTGRLCTEGYTVETLFRRNVAPPPRIWFTLNYDSNLFEDLRAFLTLLGHLDRIEKVDLNLSPMPYLDSTTLVLNSNWLHLFTEVLNVIATKPHARLAVGPGRTWRSMGKPFRYEHAGLVNPQLPPNRLHHAPPITSSPLRHLLRPIFRFMEAIIEKLRIGTVNPRLSSTDTEQYVRKPRDYEVVVFPATSPALKDLYVHSPILMELPFFHWTLHTLNNSPLQTLSFLDISLTHYDWEYVLSYITIPTLLFVCFGSSNIAFPDLQKFLARHPSLTTLDLASGDPIGPLKPLSSRDLLPCLLHLIAKPEYLAHFLEPPDAFPALQTITLVCDLEKSLIDYDFTHQLKPTFQRIANRQQDITLCLRGQPRAGFGQWLRSVQERTSAGLLEKVPTVVSFKLMTSAVTPAEQNIVTDLVNFLPLFPSLKHLSLPYWTDVIIEGHIKHSLRDALHGLETINGQYFLQS